MTENVPGDEWKSQLDIRVEEFRAQMETLHHAARLPKMHAFADEMEKEAIALRENGKASGNDRDLDKAEHIYDALAQLYEWQEQQIQQHSARHIEARGARDRKAITPEMLKATPTRGRTQ